MPSQGRPADEFNHKARVECNKEVNAFFFCFIIGRRMMQHMALLLRNNPGWLGESTEDVFEGDAAA